MTAPQPCGTPAAYRRLRHARKETTVPTAELCICDPTRGQSCAACDGTHTDDDDPRPEPCAYRYPGLPVDYCCEDALDGTPYCGLHIDDPADPDDAYDLYRDTRDLAVA